MTGAFVRFIWENAATKFKIGSEADAVCTLDALSKEDAEAWALEAFTGRETVDERGRPRPRYGTGNDGVLRRTSTADRIEFGSTPTPNPEKENR